MDKNTERFTVVARPDELSANLKMKIEACLVRNGFIKDDRNPHTVLVAGGDGTFIFAVHKYLHQLNTVRFYGIHTGTLGFYMDYKDSELDEFLDTYKKGKVWVESYPLLECITGQKHYFAINEVRIENAARTQVLEVSINGEKWETFRGTGMLVSTQLGSTAYNRSLGGAVIQEGLDLIELDEISGIHHSKYRSLDAPLVLKADTRISFYSSNYNKAVLGIDSDVYPLNGEGTITVQTCSYLAVKMLRGKKVSYFERLKSLF